MPRTKRVTHYLIGVTLSFLSMFGGLAEACMVCIPFPQDTVADHLVSAKVVVLARENPKKPFSYIAVEVLKGDLDTPEIELFLDSTKRRLLALNPDRFVVLALEDTALPQGSGGWHLSPSDTDSSRSLWRSLGYASPRYEAVVREILAQAPRWRERAGGERRATYFMHYLADPEPAIRELAYLEVGRASYDTIRQADRFVSADQLSVFLAGPQYLEWRAPFILLLGVNAKPNEKDLIRGAMERRARFDLTLNLSAWATALIEIDGEEAIAWLEKAYLRDPTRDPDTVLEITNALSVHGYSQRSGLRKRIAESYEVLIKTHSSLAGWAARDLTNWKDWRFAEAFEELRKNHAKMDGATAFSADYYIKRARVKK